MPSRGGADAAAGCDVGIVGLGVMGRNLALNLVRNGRAVAAFDAAPDLVGRLAAAAPVTGCADPAALAAALARPRTLLLMVPAGAPVDAALAELAPHLAAGDRIIDGGNSHFLDTRRRSAELGARGIDFLGTGISGGEAGARDGAAIMAGGPDAAWAAVRPLLDAIAARVDGRPCCDHFGADGAGHFVKMIHNGIEYADMQMIAECVFLLRRRHGLAADAVADLFQRWNDGPLGSYLVEITAAVLRATEAGRPLVDLILDRAGQKGTGQWASVAALELGVPAPTITEAVAARALSALQPERVAAEPVLPAMALASAPPPVEAYADALLGAKICAYAQGFAALAAARDQYGWRLDPGAAARVWQGGCIIRAKLLHDIAAAYAGGAAPANLLRVPSLGAAVARALPGWRRAVADAVLAGLPVPALGSALAYHDAYRSGRLWADVIQGQRDYFGAHGFARIDRPGTHHGPWGTA